MNSMSSVLSFNQFDFGPIFTHGEEANIEKKGEKHQPSFMKQLIYFSFFTVLNLGFVKFFLKAKLNNLKHRLTISTEITLMPMDSVKMVDTNGNIHKLPKLQVRDAFKQLMKK